MARNRTRDTCDLGAFLSGAQKGVTLILAPLPCELFSSSKKAFCEMLMMSDMSSKKPALKMLHDISLYTYIFMHSFCQFIPLMYVCMYVCMYFSPSEVYAARPCWPSC